VVNRLIRVRYGDLMLPKHLPAGGYTEYALEEVNYLRKVVHMDYETETLAKPEDKEERRRRMASIKRAVRKHQILQKNPELKAKAEQAAEQKAKAKKPAKPVFKGKKRTRE